MGVFKYALKWITTTKGKELKMEILCVIYMSVPKQTQNTKITFKRQYQNSQP